MRKRAAAAAATASLSVLAIGWLVGTPAVASLQNTLGGSATDATVSAAASAPAVSTPTATDTAPAVATATPTATATATPAAAAPAAGVTGTFTGSVVATRFGNMQVSATIAAGTITDVTALQLTDKDSKSVQISNRAAPVLKAEVLKAQSAAVANVSGATYTTQGYLTSLQAALDAAGF
ncbi:MULTISPECIES: FMN-binding protein [unclassified Cryobacterium]|uniref:FMN-binding protein n=1 Tax=unclassified Cryobacterium TaxID=2649013 RepID=UPI002AB3615E|nr:MULTISPECIES: FMN-binding protein [unclassified Cryobacterium]MDY7529032.1 FMN-binding protein [Cryobacterium sp. 10C2]MDY7558801.1 FMN-binding protein [Cryobacterium sp. 10C3]MEB0202045.1 FMN-binding protein [Cryobacterium sp. 5I3]MEB0289916.1 FMN-binding protein [Cryobacterium sp. 10C2]